MTQPDLSILPEWDSLGIPESDTAERPDANIDHETPLGAKVAQDSGISARNQ